MLGVQGVESYNKTGLEKLLVARLKEVFSGRHKKADVAAMIKYFEKKREQLGVEPGDHLYVRLRGRNPPPSDYFERPAVGRPRAGLTKEAAYRTYAPRENPWLNYFKTNFARVKAANPGMASKDIMREVARQYKGGDKPALKRKGARQKGAERRRAIAKSNKEFIEVQEAIKRKPKRVNKYERMLQSGQFSEREVERERQRDLRKKREAQEEVLGLRRSDRITRGYDRRERFVSAGQETASRQRASRAEQSRMAEREAREEPPRRSTRARARPEAYDDDWTGRGYYDDFY